MKNTAIVLQYFSMEPLSGFEPLTYSFASTSIWLCKSV